MINFSPISDDHFTMIDGLEEIFGLKAKWILVILDSRRTAGGGSEVKVAPVAPGTDLGYDPSSVFECYRDDLRTVG